nr:PLDc N-terminal domain-containing protein [Clostridium akagii]
MFLPLIILEFGLKIFCFFKLYNDKVKFFPKYIWLVIILLISTIGPLAYLIIGRKRD